MPLRSFSLALIFLLLCPGSAMLRADDEDELTRLYTAHLQAQFAGNWVECESIARKLVAYTGERYRDAPLVRLGAQTMLLAALSQQGRDDEAEPLVAQAKQLAEQLDGSAAGPASKAIGTLALHLHSLGRWPEAEALYQKYLAINRASGQPSKWAAEALQYLSVQAFVQHRDAEAEHFLRQAYDEYSAAGVEENLGESLTCLCQLSLTQARLGRPVEAEATARQALELAEQGAPDHALIAALTALESSLADQRRFKEAIPYVERALKLAEKAEWMGPLKTSLVTSQMESLADLHAQQGDAARAETLLREGLALTTANAQSPTWSLAASRFALAEFLFNRGRVDEAQALFNQHVPFAGQPLHRQVLFARIEYAKGDRDSAIEHLQQTIKASQTERQLGGGDDLDLAHRVAQSTDAYYWLAAWLAEDGKLDEAWNVAQLGRGDVLEAQMRQSGVDLWSGLPTELMQPLRTRWEVAHRTLAQAERKLRFARLRTDLPEKDLQDFTNTATSALDVARQDVIQVERDLRNASPLAKSSQGTSVSLAEVQSYVNAHKTMLVQYLVAKDGVWRFVLSSDQPARLEPVVVPDNLAKSLGVRAGPLNRERLDEVLSVMGPQFAPLLAVRGVAGIRSTTERPVRVSLVRALADPQAALEVGPRLNQLWTLLLSETDRAALVSNRYQRLVVIPDGPLAELPFECLVVDTRDASPTYLLDVGPPIVYSPSPAFTLKAAIKDRTRRALSVAVSPGQSDREPETVSPGEGLNLPRRVVNAIGPPEPLKHAEEESEQLMAALQARGWSGRQLMGDAAREQEVVNSCGENSLLHFACHGFVDHRFGNRFGLLALAEVTEHVADSTVDGFLTAAEVVGLPLGQCQVAILSACETNAGPEQLSDGVWGLSRAFLIAGTRTVIASNWSVEDQSTSLLMAEWARQFAASPEADIGPALQIAKRRIRGDDRFRSPFFWAGFVQVGQ